jgi:uncharacterized protein
MANADGDDGDALSDYDLIGSVTEHSGLFALDRVDFNFLCIPPLSRERDIGFGTLLVAARFCGERRAFLLVDPPRSWVSADDALRGVRAWPFAPDNALMYFPRLLAQDRLRGRFEQFAPSGAVAGMLARADEVWPVWSAAEGDEPILRPGFRPTCMVTSEQRQRLATNGINTLQSVRSKTRLDCSLRTMAARVAATADIRYVAARRLTFFILNSIERGTRWVRVAPRSAATNALVAAQVTQFLEQINDEGAFLGRPPEDAFFVICDERLNPPADTTRSSAPVESTAPAQGGEFKLLIGLAALRAGEFHCFQISQAGAASRVSTVSFNRLQLQQYNPLGEDALSADELRWAVELARQFK